MLPKTSKASLEIGEVILCLNLLGVAKVLPSGWKERNCFRVDVSYWKLAKHHFSLISKKYKTPLPCSITT